MIAAAFLHRLFRHRHPVPVRRASHVNIAVLEYDLYGVPPEPGTMASAAIGLRALANAGTGAREMMHLMSDCPATGTIQLDGQPAGVICNLPAHDGAQHHDNVLGNWNSEEQQ